MGDAAKRGWWPLLSYLLCFCKHEGRQSLMHIVLQTRIYIHTQHTQSCYRSVRYPSCTHSRTALLPRLAIILQSDTSRSTLSPLFCAESVLRGCLAVIVRTVSQQFSCRRIRTRPARLVSLLLAWNFTTTSDLHGLKRHVVHTGQDAHGDEGRNEVMRR